MKLNATRSSRLGSREANVSIAKRKNDLLKSKKIKGKKGKATKEKDREMTDLLNGSLAQVYEVCCSLWLADVRLGVLTFFLPKRSSRRARRKVLLSRTLRLI